MKRLNMMLSPKPCSAQINTTSFAGEPSQCGTMSQIHRKKIF